MIPLLFSVMFLVVCLISLITGLYVIQNNRRAPSNKCYFALICSIILWASGLSLAVSAADLATCEFWRRVAALGWGTFYSINLHFIILITGKEKILKTWWSYALLYLPALVTVLAFSIPIGINFEPYRLIHTRLGWVNIAENNIWDWIFYAYYIAYFITGMVIVFRWGKKSSDKKIKAQARIILFSFIAALIFASITDVLLSSLQLPQMAPIIMLIPISAIYFTMNRYGFLEVPAPDRDEIILKDYSINRILHYIFLVFVAGSAINLITQWLIDREFSFASVFFLSGLFAAIGVVMKLIAKTSITSAGKERIIGVTFSILIPLISLRFSEYGSVTVWAAVFILMLIALVFNKRMILVAITFSATFTQLLIWTISPVVVVVVDAPDYLVRIGIIFIAMMVSSYINRLYVQRLKENVRQTRFQRLVSEISYDFVTANHGSLDTCIQKMLSKTGDLIHCDRAYVVLFTETGEVRQTQEWNRAGVLSIAGDFSPDLVPMCIGQLLENNIVVLPDCQQLGDDRVKKLLHSRNIRSLIAIPIKKQGFLLGFLGFNASEPINRWNLDAPDDLGVIANITADALIRVSADDEISFMAYYDQLTKLPNRFLLKDRINQALTLSTRTEKIVGIVFIDLDSFKIINDSLGHEQGDELLIEVAKRLEEHVRNSDTVSRYGGDEFVIMLNNIAHTSDVIRIVESIINVFTEPMFIREQEFFVTISAGVALYPKDGENADDLIKNADLAMYKAKRRGKNQYELCSEDMKDESVEKLKLTNLLYRAVEREQLLLHYQPQICLETQRIIGVEALLRWVIPEIGLVSPAKFIPLAERSGVINTIGEWVIRTACRQNKAWQDVGLPAVRMAVNVSLNQLRNPNLIEIISEALKETRLEPEYLEIEITESVASNQSDNFIDTLQRIKELGISISIDDFGTEYSSLSRLKSLPIDRIKMDMQFVRDIEGSEKDQAIAKVIINLAKSLGLKVIAEGVETAPQLEYLNQRMCDEVQGFYYYKPMPAEDIEALLKGMNDSS